MPEAPDDSQHPKMELAVCFQKAGGRDLGREGGRSHKGHATDNDSCDFEPFSRKIEIFQDPRLTGLVDANAAQHVPLIR